MSDAEEDDRVPLYWALGVGHRFIRHVDNLGWDRPTPWHLLSENGARLKRQAFRLCIGRGGGNCSLGYHDSSITYEWSYSPLKGPFVTSIVFRDHHTVRIYLTGDEREREAWDFSSDLIDQVIRRLLALFPKRDPKYGHLMLSDDSEFPMTVTCSAEATDYLAPEFWRKKFDVGLFGRPWKFSDILRRLFDAIDSYLSVRENHVPYEISHAVPESMPIHILWSNQLHRNTLDLLTLKCRDADGQVELECISAQKPHLEIRARSPEVLALTDEMERFRRTESWHFTEVPDYGLWRKAGDRTDFPPHYQASCGYRNAQGESWLMTDWQWCEARARLERMIRCLKGQ